MEGDEWLLMCMGDMGSLLAALGAGHFPHVGSHGSSSSLPTGTASPVHPQGSCPPLRAQRGKLNPTVGAPDWGVIWEWRGFPQPSPLKTRFQTCPWLWQGWSLPFAVCRALILPHTEMCLLRFSCLSHAGVFAAEGKEINPGRKWDPSTQPSKPGCGL